MKYLNLKIWNAYFASLQVLHKMARTVEKKNVKQMKSKTVK